MRHRGELPSTRPAVIFDADDLSSPAPLITNAIDEEVAIATTVAAAWDIEVAGVERVGSDRSPTTNLLITTRNGDRLILKGRQGEAGIRLGDETELAIALHRAGVPVSMPVAATRGEVAVRHGEMWWVLQRFVAGEHFTGGGDQLAEAARGLVALSSAATAARWHRAPPEDEGGAAAWLAQTVLSRSFTSWAPPAALDHRESLQRAAAEVVAGTGDRRGGEVPVHLDLHPANLVYAGDRLVAILDMEDVAIADPVAAAGFAGYKLVRRQLVGTDGAAGPARTDEWREALADAGWAFALAALRAGALQRVMILIARILHAEEAGDHRYLGDLGKQLRSVEEIVVVFRGSA